MTRPDKSQYARDVEFFTSLRDQPSDEPETPEGGAIILIIAVVAALLIFGAGVLAGRALGAEMPTGPGWETCMDGRC